MWAVPSKLCHVNTSGKPDGLIVSGVTDCDVSVSRDIQCSAALNGVCMEDYVFPHLPDQPDELADGLDGADLVVGQHDAYQDSPVGDSVLKGVSAYQPETVYRQVCYLEAEFLQELAGMEYRMVLDGGGDYMITLILQSEGDPSERSVVRLSAAACENDLSGLAPEYLGYGRTCFVNRLMRLLG